MQQGVITDLVYSEQPLQALQERHKHNHYQLLYIVQGSLTLEIAGKRLDCSAPALVFIGSYEPHLLAATSLSYHRYVMTLDPEWVEKEVNPAILRTVFSVHPIGFSHVVPISPIAERITADFEALLEEWQAASNKRLAGGLSLLLSAMLYRIYRHSPESFANRPFGAPERLAASVKTELEGNPAGAWNLDDLAARRHVSRYYLAHTFKRVTGYSLQSYQMLCRISLACQQLAEGETAVGEIAEACGFRDMSNFSRAFRQTIGMSPTAYRKSCRSESVQEPMVDDEKTKKRK